MKKILFVLAFIIASSVTVFSQEDYTIKETNDDIGADNSVHNVFKISFIKASKDIAEKEVKSFIKDNKGKAGSVGKQMFGDNLVMEDVTANTFDLYAKFFQNDNGSLDVYIALDLGGAYMSSSAHPEISKRFDKYLQRMALNIHNECVVEQIKDEEKKLKHLEKELQKLEKQKENLKSDIDDYKDKIKKAESDIDANVNAQVEKRKSIDEQRKTIETIKSKHRK